MSLRHAGFSDACMSTVQPILASLPVRIHDAMAFPWAGIEAIGGEVTPDDPFDLAFRMELIVRMMMRGRCARPVVVPVMSSRASLR